MAQEKVKKDKTMFDVFLQAMEKLHMEIQKIKISIKRKCYDDKSTI